MFREITWSKRATYEWADILDYWTKRNKSNSYSLRLDRLFKEIFGRVAKSAEIGKPTDLDLVRMKIVRDYLVYYRISSDYIEILAVWDSRRNPKKFKL